MRYVAFLAALGVLGCSGIIEDPAATPPSGDTAEECLGCAEGPEDVQPGVAVTPLQRLTRAQYANTVRDLTGVQIPDDRLMDDEKVGAFRANVQSPVDLVAVETYLDVAREVAARAELDDLVACEPAPGEEIECAQRFTERFVARAYRRPIEPEEREGFLETYAVGAEGGGFEGGIRLIIEAALASPEFFYRIESSKPTARPGIERLDAHSLASRLAFFLWRSMPDEELFALAESGELLSTDTLRAQAERMLTDDKARAAITSFQRQWLGIEDAERLSKSSELFPGFDADTARAMLAESDTFADRVIRRGDGKLETLFTASFSFVEPPLLDIYGVDAMDGSGGPARVELDPERRAGIFTQASLLASHAHEDRTSPIHRGLLVRQNIMCQQLPSPPPDLDTTLPELGPDATERERLAVHRESPECAGCHNLMDPLGFGFEGYDAIGRYRATENGEPVDTSGEILGSEDADGHFEGAVELAHRLLDSEQVHRCMAEQWLRFALGRSLADPDATSVDALATAFASSGYDVRELLLDTATTFAFLHRRVDDSSDADGEDVTGGL